jgi:hypothetical protein
VTPWLLVPAFIVCPLERDWPRAERDVLLPDLPELDRPLRDEVEPVPVELASSMPAMAISLFDPDKPRSSDQSVIWSLRRLICSLIWLRFDQRKTPAPTAAAAAAALAIGRSRTLSIQSLLYWLRPLGLLFRLPR